MDKIILNVQNFIERAENASGKTCKIADHYQKFQIRLSSLFE